jgi:PHD/YefM family antitoxin component YafN of YafNO toxin-antitoxin module
MHAMIDSMDLDISEARRLFTSLDKRLEDHPVIYVRRHNKQAFAIVNIDYLEAVLETVSILADPDALEALQRSVEDIKNGRVHTHEAVKRELG